jgi:hypothetical protein
MTELTVGDLVQNLKFSKEEKIRIVNQLGVGSQVRKIFLANAKGTQQFKNISSQIKIPGQSPGRPGHTKKALDVIIKDLTEGTASHKKIGWFIYRASVASHVIGQLKNLNNLLREVPSLNENLSSKDLLEIICKNCKQYEVEPEAIKEFYELWGFDRIENFDELIALCSKDDPLALAIKKINNLENMVLPLSQQVEALNARNDIDSEKLDSFQNEFSSLSKSLEIEQEITNDLESSIKELSENFEEQFKNLGEIKEKDLKQLKNDICKLNDSNEKLSKFIFSLEDNNEKLISSEFEKARNSIVEHNLESIKKELNYIDSKIEGKLKDLKDSLPSLTGHKNSEYKSPLINITPPKKVHSEKIKDEWNFINIWREHLKCESDLYLPIEFVTILHLIFKSSDVLIFDNDTIFHCWLRTLGWENFNLQAAASPTWMSENDWGNEVQYLFGERDSATPKIVTIHQYNVALASCYLVPTVKIWSLSPGYFPLSKLVLVESGSENRSPTSDLLEVSTYFHAHQANEEHQFPKLKKHDLLSLGKEKKHTGVNPDIFRSWLLEPKKDDGFNSDIDTVAGIIDVKIPISLKLHFARIRNELEQYFIEDDSKIVAAYHVIFPWLKAKVGQQGVEKFKEAINDLFSKPLKYK